MGMSYDTDSRMADPAAVWEKHANAYRDMFFDMQDKYFSESDKVVKQAATIKKLRERIRVLDKLDDL